MFHRHLERQQLKGRECFCVLSALSSKQYDDNHCFLLKPKTESSQMCPSYPIPQPKEKFNVGILRKHSLKPNQKQNDNSNNIVSNKRIDIPAIATNRKDFFRKNSTKTVKFTYQTHPIPSQCKLTKAVMTGCQEPTAHLKNFETQNSTMASAEFLPGLTVNKAQIRRKFSILDLKRRLITQNSATTDYLLAKDPGIKTIKPRAFSTTALEPPRSLKLERYPSRQASQVRDSALESQLQREGFHKLSELCFKRAESVGSSQISEDHVSEVQSSGSFVWREKEDLEGSWNFSLNELFQKRKQRQRQQIL